jgi:transcription initiation factor TFIIB
MIGTPYASGFDEETSNQCSGCCPECDGEIKTDGGERTCRKCGLVIDGYGIAHDFEPQTFEDGPNRERTGAPLTNTRHDRGLSSQIGRFRDGKQQVLPAKKRRKLGRLRREHSRARFQSKAERNLAFGCTEIARLVSALELTRESREFACSLYRQAQDRDLFVGRSLEGFAAGSVYAVCRCRSLPHSTHEIAEVARCSERELTNAYSILNVELGLETAIQTPQDLIPKLADELDLPQTVRRRARTLAQRAVSAGLNNGCHPAGLAAATLYLEAQEQGLLITQADLADVADVSIVTLRARRDELLAVEN